MISKHIEPIKPTGPLSKSFHPSKRLSISFQSFYIHFQAPFSSNKKIKKYINKLTKASINPGKPLPLDPPHHPNPLAAAPHGAARPHHCILVACQLLSRRAVGTASLGHIRCFAVLLELEDTTGMTGTQMICILFV